MSKKRNVRLYLEDILDEITRIKNFIKNINSYNEFLKNEMVYYAVLKALENIGEAVKKIPDKEKQYYPIDWKKISGFRDVIVHDYFGIDLEVVWEVIQKKLPELEIAVKFIFKKLEESNE